MAKQTKEDLNIFLEYEIAGSYFTGFISSNWIQEIMGKYFAWKVKRKFKQYLKFKDLQNKIK